MDDLETFKRHVGYTVMAEQDTFTGNGSNQTVNLRYENIADVQVYLDNDLLADDNYEVQAEPGVITFTVAPDDGVVVTINYAFASFTDDEANALISEYGLQRAVIEALRGILANVAKLRNYKQADTQVDNSQVFKQVRELLKMYEDEYHTDQSSDSSTAVVATRKDPRGSDCYRDRDISRLYG